MKANRLIITTTTLLILLVAFGCKEKAPQSKEHISIVTTIYPYELIVRQLVTDNASVVSIIPPNASPHTYSPKPEDVKLLEDADLIISNGAELEAFLAPSLQLFSGKHIIAYDLIGNLLDSIKDEEGETDGAHAQINHHDHHINPHFWLDPLFVSRIAAEICDILLDIDPANDETYRNNLNAMSKDIFILDHIISRERKAMENVNSLNFHDAFYYFNLRYGIASSGVIVSSPGKEPTPAELVQIGRVIRRDKVKVIFVEPQLNPKAGEVLAAEFGLKLHILDPIGNKEIASTINDLIDYNWDVMRKAFGDQ